MAYYNCTIGGPLGFSAQRKPHAEVIHLR